MIFEVARLDSVGLLGLTPGADPGEFESSSWALLNVLRMVGEVADKVSNRRLVAFLPKVEGSKVVLSDSFGRFEGVGALESNGG